MGVDLPVPAYSAVCRRQAELDSRIHPAPPRRPRYALIDTTRSKAFGAGEWYVRKHGMGKCGRRACRKLHLRVDETSKDTGAVDHVFVGSKAP
jgi:hypothetical protein